VEYRGSNRSRVQETEAPLATGWPVSSGLKRKELEADDLVPSSAEVNNGATSLEYPTCLSWRGA
jgi:hypothetical protein